jgi:branched-chain amino acid transport system ATP-binding protein
VSGPGSPSAALPPPMLQVADLHGGYGTAEVLHGISFTVAPGAVVALLGANGAGKTTTMRLLSGLLRPTQGTIHLDGAPIQGLPSDRIAALGLAHAPEGRRVFGPLSAEDNLLLGAYTRLPHLAGYREQAAADLEAVYERFPRLRDRRRQQAATLSGGEQQMLAIGRALMARPRSCCWTSLPWDLRRW